MGFIFNSLSLATSPRGSWEDCLSLTLDEAVSVWPCCPPHTAAAVQRPASCQEIWDNTGSLKNIFFPLFCIYAVCIATFFLSRNMSQSEKQSTPCSMSATRLPRVCNSFTGHLMICVLQWQSSLARSYLSLIQNCGVTHMRAPIPANAGELRRTCQPRSDTEHDNVCNLLHVVCRPPALPFEVLPPVPLQPKCNSTTKPDKEKKKSSLIRAQSPFEFNFGSTCNMQ